MKNFVLVLSVQILCSKVGERVWVKKGRCERFVGCQFICENSGTMEQCSHNGHKVPTDENDNCILFNLCSFASDCKLARGLILEMRKREKYLRWMEIE